MERFDCAKVKEFFDKEIEAPQFARMMRRYNQAVVNFYLEMETKGQQGQFDLFIMKDGFYWLNELAELIDPQLDVDN
ncbi:hypothetical protein SDC9_33597 [bioreactor metagenome]|jgi:hypothetical protein|uniref:Uncharacterized protein n=1 Tax=bioreactor metagenome TaxID=1076179 RepID=A0A644V8B6_9ZZZZ